MLENGHRWGSVAEPWQVEDAVAILDTTGPRRHFLTRPRGASKTSDLAGVSIALMLEAPPSSRSYAFAGDRDQASLLMDSITGFLGRTSEVRGALQTDNHKLVNPATDATLTIMASDESTAWGLRPWLVIVDELANWRTTRGPRELWRAVFSALPKVADSRLVVLTSAGDPSHWSHKILTDAISHPSWRVNQVPGPTPWVSESDLEEQQHLLPEWEYQRLHMNRWTDSPDRLTTVDDVTACVVLDGPSPARQGVRYVIGLDVGLTRDRTVASVCHLEDNSVVLDRQQTWAGTSANPVRLEDVEVWLTEAIQHYNRPPVVFDPWQAQHLAQRLRERRVRMVEFTFSNASVGRLALTMHRLLKDRQLKLYDDEALIEELGNVRLIETSPGSYRIDHDSGQHDDRVISLSLAAQHLLTRPVKKHVDRNALAKAFARSTAELWKPSGGLVGY